MNQKLAESGITTILIFRNHSAICLSPWITFQAVLQQTQIYTTTDGFYYYLQFICLQKPYRKKKSIFILFFFFKHTSIISTGTSRCHISDEFIQIHRVLETRISPYEWHFKTEFKHYAVIPSEDSLSHTTD